MATQHEAYGPASHRAQFYDDIGFLAGRVGKLFGEALHANGSVIAIARPEHRDAILVELACAGFDLGRLRESRRLVLLDADATLSRMLVDDRLDRDAFFRVVGQIVGDARAATTGPLHIYGEMVDVLWNAKRGPETVQLEELWNELSHQHDFTILCGYRLGAFTEQRHVHMFHELCNRHGVVAPTEQQADVVTDSATSRAITELEQRARSLQVEVAHRGLVELRLEQLLAVTSDLAAATSNEAIARIAIDKGIAAVGGSYGGLWLIDPEAAALTMLAVSQLPRGDASRWTKVPLAIDAPVAHVARTCEPLFLESLADYEKRFPASFERIADTISSPDLAYAVLPLTVNDGTALGVLSLTYENAQAIEAGERTFLSILARQCAQALTRVRSEEELSRSLREERQAHLDAQEAMRARDEILAVVSHDLRNPLGTILMGASTLLQVADPADKKAQRVVTVGQRIHRQAERMARMIEDLVDYAGIQAGRLEIERGTHAPERIVAQASELFGPLAHERGLRFETTSATDLPAIDCDCERVVQIFANLVTNALKVTPRGGAISIGVTPMDDELVFFVRDTGPGIEPDEMPGLFERYWRSRHPTYKGTGLGLSIARGIVDAHGGRIWAESQIGAGSTFYFSLQTARNN